MNRLPIPKLHASFLFIGFGSILSQIILVREFLISFYGNELSIGIIFAVWLIWIGIGSFLGNRSVKRRSTSPHLFSILLAVIPILTLVQIIAVKFVRTYLPSAPGEFLSVLELLGCSFIVLSAVCFLWGMLFTLGAKLLSQNSKLLWLGVNRAYILELLGSVLGGLVFSFLLASILSPLQIILLLAFCSWILVLWIIYLKKTKSILFSLLACIVLYAVLLDPVRLIEQKINALQWSFINDKLTYIRSVDTKYQRLSLLRLNNQYTVYADGRPAYNFPNTYDAELFAHSIMVHRPEADHVLILGGGFNGLLRELLKYRINEIDYLETDPSLIRFAEPILDSESRQAMNNPKVKIITGDGREYLRRTNQIYDIILLNVGEPSTANINRFYTLEFYRQCISHLSPSGIFAFSFPSSTEYIADELKDMNISLYRTFKQVFVNTLIIPGSHAILIGSKSNRPLISQPDSLAGRYRSAGISSEYFSEYMYKDLLLPERVKFINEFLESTRNYKLNTDSNPVTYYFNLLLWNRFSYSNSQFFSSFTHSRIFIAAGVGAGILLLLLARSKGPNRKNKAAPAIIIACGGFIGMALNLLLLLNFQETFGSVYEMVGAMIAANMLGMVFGALAAVWLMRNYRWKLILLFVLLVLTFFVFLTPVILNALLTAHAVPLTLLVTIFSGALIGMLFGIANRIYLEKSKNVGNMYAFDVLGSSIGALTTCSILLPVLGIHETTYLLTIIVLPAIVAALLVKGTT